MTPEDRARRSAEAMWEQDSASQWIGMTLDTVGPGEAVTSLTVAEHHCNGHGICHGGVIFTLADSAFAFACNSYNQATVAQQNSITFVAPGREGDLLRATAEEVVRSGRSGVYDVTVRNQNNEVIAVMRGNSRQISGTHFEEETTDG